MLVLVTYTFIFFY